MPSVKIPPPYQGPTAGRDRVEVAGGSVRECLEAVGKAYPGFREQIFDASGNVHRFVSLFINGDEIPRSQVDAAVEASDEVEILAAIAGG